MDVISIFLSYNNIKDAVYSLTKNVQTCPDFLLKSPFYLFKYARSHAIAIDKIKQELELITINNNIKYIRKHDELFNANKLSFIANLFAKLCKLKTPDIILLDIQIIQYIPNWVNYYLGHPRDPKFTKHLAKILAFDLTIGNVDRFHFIFKYIDNILFKDDQEYQQMNIWDGEIVNDDNFGFVDGELWSINHMTLHTLKHIKKYHTLLTDNYLSIYSELMSQYFILDSKIFNQKLNKYISYNLQHFNIYVQLYNWILI